jgi:hypothetical protein
MINVLNQRKQTRTCIHLFQPVLLYHPSMICRLGEAEPTGVHVCLQVTDCNGQTSTAEAFEQPIVASADTYSYSTSPLTVIAADGLLKNDAVPPSCAGIAPTFAVATPAASGTVVVSPTVLAQCGCMSEAEATVCLKLLPEATKRMHHTCTVRWSHALHIHGMPGQLHINNVMQRTMIWFQRQLTYVYTPQVMRCSTLLPCCIAAEQHRRRLCVHLQHSSYARNRQVHVQGRSPCKQLVTCPQRAELPVCSDFSQHGASISVT